MSDKKMVYDVFCASIVEVLTALLSSGKESAELVAKELAESNMPLKNLLTVGASSTAGLLDEDGYEAKEIIKWTTIYAKFLEKFNPDGSPKSFFSKTFQGPAFIKNVDNDQLRAVADIYRFLKQCCAGTANPKWFKHINIE